MAGVRFACQGARASQLCQSMSGPLQKENGPARSTFDVRPPIIRIQSASPRESRHSHSGPARRKSGPMHHPSPPGHAGTGFFGLSIEANARPDEASTACSGRPAAFPRGCRPPAPPARRQLAARRGDAPRDWDHCKPIRPRRLANRLPSLLQNPHRPTRRVGHRRSPLRGSLHAWLSRRLPTAFLPLAGRLHGFKPRANSAFRRGLNPPLALRPKSGALRSHREEWPVRRQHG